MNSPKYYLSECYGGHIWIASISYFMKISAKFNVCSTQIIVSYIAHQTQYKKLSKPTIYSWVVYHMIPTPLNEDI